MKEHELFSNSICDEQMHLAECELSAFICAVTALFGPDQARASTQDWLDAAETLNSALPPTSREWRSVTIAASARLASRIDAAQYRHKSLTASGDTKVSPILSSNCFSSILLF
jgi:hypothetical protein